MFLVKLLLLLLLRSRATFDQPGSFSMVETPCTHCCGVPLFHTFGLGMFIRVQMNDSCHIPLGVPFYSEAFFCSQNGVVYYFLNQS